ncbi:MAG: galactokinase [Nocardioidaceae bacterium]
MTSTWSAPGRVNLIGEHVDYNEGLVLPFALPLRTTARVSVQPGGLVRVVSDSVAEPAELPLTTRPGTVTGWASYVAGVVWALAQEPTLTSGRAAAAGLADGLLIEVHSDLPIGAGLSSSAALACSVACALSDELGLRMDRRALASVARRAENEYVGVPTGMMDQLAVMLCEPGHAMLLDCRTSDVTQIPLNLPAADLELLVVDTHAEHTLVGSEYAERRQACEQAAEQLGVGSLRDATLEALTLLTDAVVRRRARHVVTEIARVREVVAMLESGHPELVGDSLTASHASLRDDFEVSCDELDATVDAALETGAHGARMVGGGFGGCVIALCGHREVAAVRAAVEARYRERNWPPPTIWAATPSAGARRVPPDPGSQTVFDL